MPCSDTWIRKGGQPLLIRVTGDETVELISLARRRVDLCSGQSTTKTFTRAQLEGGVEWELRDCTRDSLRLAVESEGDSVDVTIAIGGTIVVNDKCTRAADPIVGRWTVTVMCPGGREAFCNGGG